MEVVLEEVKILRKEVEELRSELQQLKCGESTSLPESNQPVSYKSISLPVSSDFAKRFHQWTMKIAKKSPFALARPTTVLKEKKAYFNGGITTSGGSGRLTVYCYDLESDGWTQLSSSPQYYSSMAIVNGMVTLIGGKLDKGDSVTSDIISFQESGKRGEWTMCLPPLPVPRCFSASVTHGNLLIVVGGEVMDGARTDAVDILDIDTLQWISVSPLPEATANASIVVLNDTVYVLAGNLPKKDERNDYSKSAYSCSLSNLVQSSSESGDVWNKLPDMPVTATTASIMSGSLVIIGGLVPGKANDSLKSIHAYLPDSEKWNLIGYISKARAYAGVVALDSGSRTLIVGGQTASNTSSSIGCAEIIEAKN